MNEKDFEILLANTMPELPPKDVVADVTPWKKSLNRVLIGIVLSVFTLNFFCLNYILSAIGIVFLILGFRTLRYENRWFEFCFYLTIIRAAYLLSSLIINTTIIQSSVNTSFVGTVMTYLSIFLWIILFVCLWRAFISVQRKVGLPTHACGAVWLIIWYTLLCVLALFQYGGFVIAVGMIIGYVFIIRNLYRLSKELDEAGYSIKTASIKITDKCIVIPIALFLTVGSVCGYLFGNSYPMEWTQLDSSEHDNVEDIKSKLLELGFPEYVINDISPDDIAACEGALQVVADVSEYPLNDGRIEKTEYFNSDGELCTNQKTVYDVKELRLTGIAVQIADKQEHWIIFHHFLWTTAPDFYGTEAIQLWPVYESLDGWRSSGDITGRLLYDNDGKTFVADYFSLSAQTYTSNNIFRNKEIKTDIFATFSMENDGSNHRGYLAYPIDEVQDGYIIDSWFNYTHQQNMFQYPVVTAMEKRMTYGWNDAGAFKTIQYALQFDPSEK